jgi:hypothetical protein
MVEMLGRSLAWSAGHFCPWLSIGSTRTQVAGRASGPTGSDAQPFLGPIAGVRTLQWYVSVTAVL